MSSRVLIVSIENPDTWFFWESRVQLLEAGGWTVRLVWAGSPDLLPQGCANPLGSAEIERHAKRGLLLLCWPLLSVSLLARLRHCLDIWENLDDHTDLFLVDGEAPELVINSDVDFVIQHNLIGIRAHLFLDRRADVVSLECGENTLISCPAPELVLTLKNLRNNRLVLRQIYEFLVSSPTNFLSDFIAANGTRFLGWPREFRPAMVTDKAPPAVMDFVGFDWQKGVFLSHLKRPITANQVNVLTTTVDRLQDDHPARMIYITDPDRAASARRRIRLLFEFGEDSAIPQAIYEAIAQGDASEVPDPFFESATAFYDWLSLPATPHDWMPRYWRALINSRSDIRCEFPDLESDDRAKFLAWTRSRALIERVPIAPPVREHSLVEQHWVQVDGASKELEINLSPGSPSIDICGYLDRRSSLGEISRKIFTVAKSRVQSVHVTLYGRTRSPKLHTEEFQGTVSNYARGIDASIRVINADQLGFFIRDQTPDFRDARRRVGYWFWELEDAPPGSELFVDDLDEVWTASEFVRSSVAKVFKERTRLVPIPVGRPVLSDRCRDDFGLPSEGFMFLTTFDFYSCSERKNPEGSIRAFMTAFPEASGDQFLVIKSLHGEEMWPELTNLMRIASERSDIIFLDVNLSDADQNALLAEADCLVSLHRSEGFGLHLAQAMYLGTPVIATGYSANLDFMDDESALLVPYTFCNPSISQSIYSQKSRWADPDLLVAAEHMRLVASDLAVHARLSAAAEEKIVAYDAMAYETLVDNIERVCGYGARS